MAGAPLVELVTHPAPCGEVRSYSLVEFFFGERQQIPPATQRYSVPILVGVRQADAGEVRRVKGRYCERRPALPVGVESVIEWPAGDHRIANRQHMHLAACFRPSDRLPNTTLHTRCLIQHHQDMWGVEPLKVYPLVST